MRKSMLIAIAAAATFGLAGSTLAKETRIGNVKYNFSADPWKLDKKFLPQKVSYDTDEKPGTIIISTRKRYLYYILGGGEAMRYGIGVGRDGFKWSGVEKISRKAEWPAWTPPPEMRAREPNLPRRMPGGPDNPLGARAMYLGNTLYRIHGTSQPWSIGTSVSSGCIRLRNEDVIELYKKVRIGAKVIVE